MTTRASLNPEALREGDEQLLLEQATAVHDDWPSDRTVVPQEIPDEELDARASEYAFTEVRRIRAIRAGLVEAYAQGKRDGGGELGKRALELLGRVARLEAGDADPDLVRLIQELLGEAGDAEGRDACEAHVAAAMKVRLERARAASLPDGEGLPVSPVRSRADVDTEEPRPELWRALSVELGVADDWELETLQGCLGVRHRPMPVSQLSDGVDRRGAWIRCLEYLLARARADHGHDGAGFFDDPIEGAPRPRT